MKSEHPLVFICHASEDASVASLACQAIERTQVTCWIAPRDVPPGVPYSEPIFDAIEKSKIMVVLLSESSNDSDHVLREVELAARNRIHIIPWVIDQSELLPRLAYYLSSVHQIISNSDEAENSVGDLAIAVTNLLESVDSLNSETHGPDAKESIGLADEGEQEVADSADLEPFVLGIVADLAGSNQRPCFDERRFVELQNGNAARFLKTMAPSLMLDVPSIVSEGRLNLDLKFESFDDFAAENVAHRIPELAKHLRIRATAVTCEEILRNNYDLAASVNEFLLNPGEDLELLRTQCARRLSDQGTKSTDDVHQVLKELRLQIYDCRTIAYRTPARALASLVAHIDSIVAEQVCAIVEQPEFVQLATAWLSLQWAMSCFKSFNSIKVLVFDCSLEELIESVTYFAAFHRTSLFDQLYTRRLNTLGGEPLGILAIDFEFDHRAMHVKTLAELVKIAAVSGCVVMANAATTTLELSVWNQIDRYDEFKHFRQHVKYTDWRAFQEMEDSRQLYMLAPKFLIPSSSAMPVHAAEGVERLTNMNSTVWANSSILMAVAALRTYASTGMFVEFQKYVAEAIQELQSTESKLLDGKRVTVGPFEADFSKQQADGLQEFGIVALSSNDQLQPLFSMHQPPDPFPTLAGKLVYFRFSQFLFQGVTRIYCNDFMKNVGINDLEELTREFNRRMMFGVQQPTEMDFVLDLSTLEVTEPDPKKFKIRVKPAKCILNDEFVVYLHWYSSRATRLG